MAIIPKLNLFVEGVKKPKMPVEAFGAGLIPLSPALQENQNTYNKNKEGTIPFVPRNEQLFINN